MPTGLEDLYSPTYTDWLTAANRQRRAVRPEGGRREGGLTAFAENYVPHVLTSLATLPDRAIGAAAEMRETGVYNPGPIVETALLAMSPFSVPRGALGAGPGFYKPKEIKGVLSKESGSGVSAPVKKTEVPQESKAYDPVDEALSKIVAAIKKSEPADVSWLDMVKSATLPSKPSAPRTLPPPIKSFDEEIARLVRELNLVDREAVEKLARRTGTRKAEEYVKALEPLDWRGLTSPYATEFSRSIPVHAEQLGFNPHYPLYKGRVTNKPTTDPSFPDPRTKDYERGLFFAKEPDVARAYGGVPSQYVARPVNPAQVDWRNVAERSDYEEAVMDPLVEAARAAGHDLLKIKNIRDIGGKGSTQSQLVVLDPSIVRLPHAVFDPRRISESNLLGGLAGVGVLRGIGELESEEKR